MKILLFVLAALVFSGCRSKEKRPAFTSGDIHKVISAMTEIMVHDITNPPLAARFFSYACLAGYEITSQYDTSLKSMHGLLNGYPVIEKPAGKQLRHYELSALLAMIETAKKMQPSGTRLEQFEQALIDSCRVNGLPEEEIESSKKNALEISRQILDYARSDKYNRISNYVRYFPMNKEGSWYSTPPAYLPPVEPYFNTIRPFTLDSCSQFKPAPPVPFSTVRNSSFYKLMLLNYNDSLTEANRHIANFWDCNPFAVQDNGHLLVGLKKISPGAHWLGITGIACKKAKKTFSQGMEIFTVVSVGLMDGFICCWDEKYRSNRVRPETAIRKYVDPEWMPVLQTPPFPEYPSGHSTISSASATILSHYFGDSFSFTDSVEVPFGLPPRNFSSFRQAAEEAAISRFYGGIHFMDAITNGFIQGNKVGSHVLRKVKE